MLKLTVDLWATSMEVESYIIDRISGKPRPLRIVFDTGAYMTVIDISTLRRAGYNVNKGNDAEFDVVGRNGVPAKEILLKGLELGGRNDQRIILGPVLVYATDMSDTNTSAVLGLNVIREFKSRIIFGKDSFIELEPTFDESELVRFEEFQRTESRFGLWSQEQVKEVEGIK